MKKSAIYYSIIMLTCSLFFTSCKKDSSSPASNNYIEFKIDGQQYRMEQNQESNGEFTTGAAQHSGPTFGKYGLIVAFGHSLSDEGAGFTLIDAQKLTQPHYYFTTVDGGVFTYIMPNSTQYISGATSTLTIDFSTIDTVAAGTLEGTFSATNLELQDEDGNTISTGHTLTDGKVRTIIAQ